MFEGVGSERFVVSAIRELVNEGEVAIARGVLTRARVTLSAACIRALEDLINGK